MNRTADQLKKGGHRSMKFDFSKLLGRIIEKFGTRAAFAAAINLAESALSNRLSGKMHFDADEIYLACQLLGIEPQEIPVYFFTPEVR
jgi:hypothetical protein